MCVFNFFEKKLNSNFRRNYNESEHNITIFGIIVIIGFLGFYFLNIYLNGSKKYENIYLRLIACVLSLFLIFKNFLPKNLKKLLPWLWYVTLLYTLPFFFTFMFLKNSSLSIWQLNCLISVVVLMLLVDWFSLIFLEIIGISIAYVSYVLTTSSPSIPKDTTQLVLSILAVVTYCAFFMRTKSAFEKMKTQLATQKRISEEVAHDIRSPLTALRMATEHISILPEDQRVMIRTSTTRVNDIANNLLTNVEVTGTGHTEIRIPELLSSTLDRIVSEKRAQYSNQEITFDLQIPSDLFTIFVNVQPIELKRVLSNLINNSVEAFKKKEGTITLKLSKEGTHVSIHVIDNGCGIPPALLDKIFEEKQSFGKKGGHGLGLSHAQRVVQLWEGEITVSSELNHGTEIKIILPAETEPPVWFAPAIVVSEKSTVVVIDDDDFIHLVWKERFKESLANSLITLLSFYSLESFTEWFEKNKDPSYFLLMDYEFRNTEKTGLDSLKKLHVPSTQAVLVTSRYANSMVSELFPKTFRPIFR